MKISDLKQPYRRMAEYLAEKNENPIKNVEDFSWYETGVDFWKNVYHLDYPPITEEIKQYFPPDFDFSGEVEDERRYNFAFKNKMEEKYTQLAQQGKFDELPDTCEFSEPVELEVCDGGTKSQIAKVIGKFKGRFVEKEDISRNGYTFWNFAQLPTPKIDFSKFKSGDVVEITNKDNEKYYGLLYLQSINELVITVSYNSKSSKHILKDNILSITKIK